MDSHLHHTLPTILPNSLTTLNENKITSFVVGVQKKSRFQKAKEEAEAKKKEEESAAAKVYESFVASFAEEDLSTGKSFIRGGVNGVGPLEDREKGAIYMPIKKTNAVNKVSELESIMSEMKVILQFVLNKLTISIILCYFSGVQRNTSSHQQPQYIHPCSYRPQQEAQASTGRAAGGDQAAAGVRRGGRRGGCGGGRQHH